METISSLKPKMKVEIWSDVICPFCYIGKRQFEVALNHFDQKQNVEIIWHSFLLYPDLKSREDIDFYDYVAKIKGQSREWSIKLHEGIVATAKSVGLDYRFDKAKIANSFDAHRVIQYAKTKGVVSEIEERFFHAYYTEGTLISDHPTLIKLATEIGLDEHEVRQVLSSNQFAKEVKKDDEEAHSLGAKGVPFFVINRKLIIAGVQDSDAILQVLEKSYAEWIKENSQSNLEIIEGKSCSIDGICD